MENLERVKLRYPDLLFWSICLVLFISAIALRWIRLDLMTFRYDQAAVAFRAVNTVRSGFPLTGIVNSMGFENAGGYVWSVLPAFLISPNPLLATGWHGLICATMVFPLALLGRRYRRDGLAWLPAVLAAVLPAAVFGGRNLWAQHLLPPLVSWAILALDGALSAPSSEKKSVTNASLGLALLAWATSVHYSAGLLLVLAATLLGIWWKGSKKRLVIAAMPAVVICLTMIPSGFDWWDAQVNPRPKPDFAAKFEAAMPPPLPWWARIQQSVEGVLVARSLDVVPGIAAVIEPRAAISLKMIDVLYRVATLLPLGFLVSTFFRRHGSFQVERQRRFNIILLTWLLLPLVLASLLVPRVNAGYFLGLLPALWLLPLRLPHMVRHGWLTWAATAGVLLVGILASASLLMTIRKHPYVPGNYYVAYSDQAATVRNAVSKGVEPGRMQHLAGPWFSHSYEYIHRHVSSRNQSGMGEAYGFIEDLNITSRQRVAFYLEQKPALFGSGKVGVLVFPSRGSADLFLRKYYGIR